MAINISNIKTRILAIVIGISALASPIASAAIASDRTNEANPNIFAAPSNGVSSQLLSLKLNETIEVFGNNFTAKSDSTLIKTTSSEYVTLSVISGTLTQGVVSRRNQAKTGEAFIIPVSGQAFQKFNYDAARLMATINQEWLAQIVPILEPIAKSQRKLKFWGLLEPTSVNTAAPLPPYIERVRASYLSVPTIMELRNKSRGNPNVLQMLSAQKFKEAIAKGDIETIAALIDPLPFTDATDNAQVWLEARRNFAIQINQDSAMKAAFANGDLSQDPLIGIFFVGLEGAAYRMITVNRDSAVFVAAVEAIKKQ